ncbi:cysteine--tRNA ligase [Candidatus Bathyarchaeota archaeon A05DMB-2]|jgi:cysteinyl-tRNA synthetase|nr:cysteine--tRNA ligase [Candidatus Bathyarchaeota archaeon A05DMB-2]
MSTKAEAGICFFNTLTRRKEAFTSIEPGKVRMYTCGPTVYGYAHIGNFRAFLFEDLLKRWLQYRGFKVTHVMNITDVDDKTIRGSRKEGIPLKEYTARYAKAFFDDINALNIKPADVYPRATEHIADMVKLIETLMRKGYAYRGEDGSIYYAISKFPAYGQLSHINLSELKAGARVKSDEYAKEEAQDFALWKAWTPEDGDVFWETALGKGRPGWHIECSAMSMRYLGETFDIHCGGVDNIFPHHENEIAQSEAATGKPFVRYWLHNEHLLVEGKKMAKRFGNFYTLRDLLAKGYDPIAIRFLLLSTHYRQQANFTFEGLNAAHNAVLRLRNFVRRLLDADGAGTGGKVAELIAQVQAGFGAAMDDDLNVSVALAALFDFVREVNNLLDANAVSQSEAEAVAALMAGFDSVLGVVGKVEAEEMLPEEAEALIKEREEARKNRDWKRADEIRLRLREMGVMVEDTAAGVRWRLEKKR